MMAGAHGSAAHGVIAAQPPPAPQQQQHPVDEEEIRLYRLNALQTLGDWSVHDDGDGRLFYHNSSTSQSQWEPPTAFTGLEGELMMKLMLQHAVARSGFWSAHDAGNGTLYYFNERTRASVWERPEDWGLLPPPPPPVVQQADEDKGAAPTGKPHAGEAEDAETAVVAKPKKEKKAKRAKKSKKSSRHEGDDEENADAAVEEASAPVEQEEEPLSAQEIEAAQQREAAERKRIESFRQMLRDKKIMPFTKWSVAMPRILQDPRFMAIPTMEERRAIFEHFVQHRRDDLKAEKKAKLTDAKKAFSALLREQFTQQMGDGVWDSKTSLSVFLATLENAVDAESYQSIQENAMALLPTSVQEKLFEQVVAEFKEEAGKVKAAENELFEFLQQELKTTDGGSAPLLEARWENEKVQQLVASFYAPKAKESLSKEQQRAVFRRVQDALAPSSRAEAPRSSHHRSRDASRSRSSHSNRRRSRSRGRSVEKRDARRDSAHGSRSRDDHHRSSARRSRSRRSRSSSRSHSRSRSRRRESSSARHRHHRRSSSSSRSRSARR